MLSVTAGAGTEFPANHPCELRVSPLFFFGVKGLCGSSEIQVTLVTRLNNEDEEGSLHSTLSQFVP